MKESSLGQCIQLQNQGSKNIELAKSSKIAPSSVFSIEGEKRKNARFFMIHSFIQGILNCALQNLGLNSVFNLPY